MLGLNLLLILLLLVLLAFDLLELVRMYHEVRKRRGLWHRPRLRSDLHAIRYSHEMLVALVLTCEAKHGALGLPCQ